MRQLILCVYLLLQVITCWAADTWQFSILHTNDLHGWMMPFDYQTTNARLMLFESVDKRYAQANAGGLARRGTIIADLRKAIEHSYALVDAGDVFTRGPWHWRLFGAPEIDVYNHLGYDMLCVGNNEFKATGDVDSQAIMLGLMRQSQFPWLAANLTVGETGVPVEGIHPFIVRRYGTMRVGFLGLTAPRAKEYPQTKGWTISDPIEAAKKWVPIARKECDVLIAITHIGTDIDKLLAAQVDGIDAIIGGDSHTFLPQPLLVANPRGVQVPIVQAGAYGLFVGRLDLTFELTEGWHLIKSAGELIPVDAKVKEDPIIKKLLDEWIIPAEPAKVGFRPVQALAA